MGMHPPKGTPIKLIPAGVYGAICIAVYDLGTHNKDGLYPGTRHEISVIFEIPTQRYDVDGVSKPCTMPKRYTFTLGPKSNLRKDLEAWRGKPFDDMDLDNFDMLKMLGKYALIQVIHKKKHDGNTISVINSIMTLPKDMKMPNKPENELHHFSFEEEFRGIPNFVPKWVATEIMGSEEYNAKMNGAPPDPEDIPPADPEVVEMPEDDLPF